MKHKRKIDDDHREWDGGLAQRSGTAGQLGNQESPAGLRSAKRAVPTMGKQYKQSLRLSLSHSLVCRVQLGALRDEFR